MSNIRQTNNRAERNIIRLLFHVLWNPKGNKKHNKLVHLSVVNIVPTVPSLILAAAATTTTKYTRKKLIMFYKMDSGNSKNVQMCYKCMLLGTVLYLYANAVVQTQAQIQKQQQYERQEQHYQHQMQHEKHEQQQHEEIPLVRLPSNTLLKYTAYKDVSILHFHIPTDTRTAYFSFKAYEETRSAFCKFKNL